MGDKLGKMVKITKILFLCIFIIDIHAKNFDEIENKIELAQHRLSPNLDARIFSVSGSKDSISIASYKIAKPTQNLLSSYKLLTKRDRYALRVLNKDKEEVAILGLGNPFYIHAQHIGYEDSKVFGGYIEQDIEIALPLDMDASYLVLLSQDSNGLKEVKEIKVN